MYNIYIYISGGAYPHNFDTGWHIGIGVQIIEQNLIFILFFTLQPKHDIRKRESLYINTVQINHQ